MTPAFFAFSDVSAEIKLCTLAVPLFSGFTRKVEPW